MADDEFKARVEFFTALSQLQCDFQLDEELETALPKATAAGFSLQCLPDRDEVVITLHHDKGHSITIRLDSVDIEYRREVIEALLGLPLSLGLEVEASEVFIAASSVPAAAPAPAPPSVPGPTKSIGAGLRVRPGDQVVLAAPPKPASEPAPAPEPEPEPESFDLDDDPLAADPDPNDDPSTSTKPLSEEEKTGLLTMLRALPNDKGKAAIVAFRKAFNVPAAITKNGDAITELRHRVFLTRLIDEAENIAAP